MPLPNANSCIHFFRTIADVNSAGLICIDIENIALNIGPTTNESVSSPGSQASPGKQRKFNAIATNLLPSVLFLSVSFRCHVYH